MTTYKIVRYYQDDESTVIDTGLTLQQAKKHCNDPASKGRGWFDGYQQEEEVSVDPDPDFPDRPTHPDFKRLSEAVIKNDGLVDKGLTVADVFILAGLDFDSVLYMAQQRALRMMSTPIGGDPEEAEDRQKGNIAATWIDGFMAGRRFTLNESEVVIDQALKGFDGNRRQGK